MPQLSPQLLRRVVFNTIPALVSRRVLETDFKGGKHVFTTTWFNGDTGSASRRGERVLMFLCLTKVLLDGACGDPRFYQTNELPWELWLAKLLAFGFDIEAREVRLQKLSEERLGGKQQQDSVAEAAAASENAAKHLQAALNRMFVQHFGRRRRPMPRRALSANRKGSELPLQYELEEKTTVKSGSLVAASSAFTRLAKEFEDMKSLEKGLGLEAFSTKLAELPDGKIERVRKR
ncbi:hypothetical protein PybrP1_010251 [[Pythium] brassicae (nom. inval.)]|nr:hypothetical protein PybrP1_010251 [[Pythium] brassicae (nom. inval.)]